MAKYLLEIGTEEIPARFLPNILLEYKNIFENALDEERISYQTIQTFATPRRIVVLINEIAEMQTSLQEELKGPAEKIAYDDSKKPTKALEGFMRGNKVSLEDIFIKEVGNTNYIYALKKYEGMPTKEILKNKLPKLILDAFFPKTMRWGDYNLRYVRPLKWLVSLWDDEVLSFDLEMKQADRYSQGHRFLSKGKIEITSVAQYFEVLKKHHVIVDQDERLALIKTQIEELEKKNKVSISIDKDLLEEVLYLVEYPTVLMGDFDEKYLNIPQGLVITPMKEHQRYFPVKDLDGKIKNHFVTVRNGDAYQLDTVKIGNERVLEARLADAKFFYDEDLKNPLENNLEKLKKITFQEKLGTVYEKMERVVQLSGFISKEVLCYSDDVSEGALIASKLLKADLVSNVVMEFPELQGIMGEEYALKTMHLEKDISQAIREHYLPRFAGDMLPKTKQGIVISLSDKFDTIVGCFAAGIEPTGSQDPYALRRQCMAVTQILIQEKVHFSLKDIILKALEGFRNKITFDEQLVNKIYDFFAQRLLTYFKDLGYETPFIRAILAEGYNDLYECVERAALFYKLSKTEEFILLEQTYKRVHNMINKREPIDTLVPITEDVESKFKEEIINIQGESDLSKKLILLIGLSSSLNEYMENTMIMVEDDKLRAQRLAVLKHYKNLYENLIDLSQL